MAGWIKPFATGWRTGLWGQDGVLEFGFSDEHNIALWTFGGGSVTVPYTFPLNEWHHITATGTGSSINIYFDGKLAGSYSQRTSNYGQTPWTFNMAGGGIFDTYGNNFTGAIDEVYVYRKALSQKEILALVEKDSYLRPEIRITNPEEGQNLIYPFSHIITTEILRNECVVVSVEFFINGKSVLNDTQLPYTYTWFVMEKPEEPEFRLTVRMTNSCGIWDEHTVTVTVTDKPETTDKPEEGLEGEQNEDGLSAGNPNSGGTEDNDLFTGAGALKSENGDGRNSFNINFKPLNTGWPGDEDGTDYQSPLKPAYREQNRTPASPGLKNTNPADINTHNNKTALLSAGQNRTSGPGSGENGNLMPENRTGSRKNDSRSGNTSYSADSDKTDHNPSVQNNSTAYQSGSNNRGNPGKINNNSNIIYLVIILLLSAIAATMFILIKERLHNRK
jgi:hypothetical protein